MNILRCSPSKIGSVEKPDGLEIQEVQLPERRPEETLSDLELAPPGAWERKGSDWRTAAARAVEHRALRHKKQARARATLVLDTI